MVKYRRLKACGGIYFFTVTLRDRKSEILTEHIGLFRQSLERVLNRYPFKVNAMVVLPDHFHAVWELPEGDDNYSKRMQLLKSVFTRKLVAINGTFTKDRRGEYNIWQRRFWEHMIRNERDYEAHVNYIHYNPVKHGLVKRVRDWPYSSFHRFVREGVLPLNWSDGALMRDLEYRPE